MEMKEVGEIKLGTYKGPFTMIVLGTEFNVSPENNNIRYVTTRGSRSKKELSYGQDTVVRKGMGLGRNSDVGLKQTPQIDALYVPAKGN